VKRGEVWWYEEPHEARHPVLIIGRDEDIERLFDVIAVPITTKIRGWDTELELGTADGMSRDCAVAFHNTFLAHKIYLTGHVTTLSSVRMTEVCQVLALATDC
jgi:mRNA-degrading endonuclease toxin of MazEF toxin-antitoxin module